jgi:hypothetical protein
VAADEGKGAPAMPAVRDRALLEWPELRIVPGVSPKLLPKGDPTLHHPGGGF